MDRNNNPSQPLSLDGQSEEARIRRALGLGGAATHTHQQRPEQARQRHRFVADGDVPVVMLNRHDNEAGGLKEKLAALDSALEAERAAHAATRRLLQEASTANQALQTRLGHAELAHAEALEAERKGRRAAEEALAARQVELPQLEANRPESLPERKRPGRKPKSDSTARPTREAKPVRWWTPSYRAKRSPPKPSA